MGESTAVLQQPLLVAHPGHPVAMSAHPVKVAPREFRRSWWNIFGHCSAADVVALLLTAKLPLVAHAWNEARVNGRSFFKTVLLWVLGVGVMAMLANLQIAGMRATCPDQWHADGPTFPLNADSPVYVFTSDHGLRVMSTSADPTRATLREWQLDAALSDTDVTAMNSIVNFDANSANPAFHHPAPPPCMFLELPEELQCYGPAISTGASVAMFALIMLAVLHLARRRAAMRAQFGIPGTMCGDVALWSFCAPCALAQETRTLMHNNVHEGMWHGALPAAAHYHHVTAAPAPVAQMV